METPTWKSKISWALYDWANSAYATTVMAALFPALYGTFWGAGIAKDQTTLELAWAGGLASFAVALLGPFLGGIADRCRMKKPFLACFALISIIFTLLLAFSGAEPRFMALGAFFLSLMCFTAANIFYDSLLVDVAGEQELDFVSSLGFGLGYFGGGLLFALNLVIITNPELVGLENSLAATKVSIASVAVWWFVFSLPLFFFVKEREVANPLPLLQAAASGFQDLRRTIAKIRAHRTVLLFLLSYFFYIDGVNSVMKTAVKFGSDLGFGADVLMKALLAVQIIGFISTLGFGVLSRYIGAKPILLFCIFGYCLLSVFTLQVTNERGIYIFAGGIGFFQGALQSLSRSVFASLVPPENAGEFFGIYNLLGKFSSILGPILITVSTLSLQWMNMDSEIIQRVVIISLLPLFLIGGMTMYFLKLDKHQPLVNAV
ncbi:MAG: MFS transporter [Sumerlaeia bacterium]